MPPWTSVQTILLKYADFLHYDALLGGGLPHCHGGDRRGVPPSGQRSYLEVTGARWSLTGAEAVLRLRSLWVSGDFETYWRFHFGAETEAQPRDALCRRKVPRQGPNPRRQDKGTHLRLIK